MTYRLMHGDCIELMRAAKAEKVDAIVCDPPYGIEFMGKTWDSPGRMVGHTGAKAGGDMGRYEPGVKRPGYNASDGELFGQWCEAWATEALRVLKPGAHALVFGGTRMWHRLAAGLEDAGFEMRDTCMWLHASGMPKGRDIGRQIDKANGTLGEVVGETGENGIAGWNTYRHGKYDEAKAPREVRAPGSEAAERWSGWSTTLKPCWEPILLLRKPFKGPAFRNVERLGTGAINIDECRILYADADDLAATIASNPGRDDLVTSDVFGADRPQQRVNAEGRWPANVLLDETAAEELGAVARYYFCAKASTKEKRAGLESHHAKHPTTKPLALMRYLCRLVTPPGGLVLDPFMGSGTTGIAALLEGFKFVGMEQDAAFVETARLRIEHWTKQENVA